MSTRRTTHDKRQRERSKQQKAAAKREKRQDKTSDEQVEVADAPFDAESTEALIARMEELHANYDAGRLVFLGLGTSVGATVIADDTVVPLEQSRLMAEALEQKEGGDFAFEIPEFKDSYSLKPAEFD